MSFSEQDRAWWARPEMYREDEDSTAHQKLLAVLDFLERNQDRKRNFLLWGEMYSGGASMGAIGTGMDLAIRNTAGTARGSLSLNVSRNVVDAVVSRVFSKGLPKLSYVTEGGDYEKQDNASKLEAGVSGVMYKENYRPACVRKGRDGAVYGTGYLRVRPNYDTKKVDILRLRPWENITDDGETLLEDAGGPRSKYLKYYIDKGVLAHRVKTGWYATEDDSQEDRDYKAAMVDRLTGEKDLDAEYGFQQASLRVQIVEAWHRPSGRGAKDGRYVVGVANCTLIDEPWDVEPDQRWEISEFKWCEGLEGAYGQGIIEIGAGIQQEINKLVRKIQNGHHLITGHWMVEKMSKVQVAHINNDLSALLQYTGTMPQYVAPSIIQPEVYQHLWNLVQRYYQLAGVNEQAASATKPAGLDSGEAQRVYADQQTETLLEKGERFEESVRCDGHLITDAAKLLADDGVYEVRAMNDDGFETIDWKTVDDPDGYELRVAPTSALPGTPAGKLALANDMMTIGEFDPDDVLEMIGMPDVLQLTKRKQATRKLVEKVVGRMLREGKAYEPTPFLQPLGAVAKIATDMLNVAEAKDVDDDKLQLVRDFIVKVQKLEAASKPPPPPPAPPMPMHPPGAPGAPPPMAPPQAPPQAA